jgi:hypothetical protein
MVQLAGVAAAVAASELDDRGDDKWPVDVLAEEEKAQQPPQAWIHTVQAEIFFGGWIGLNAMLLAIECDHMKDEKAWGWIFCESIFNIVFFVECVMRLKAEKAKWVFSFWNWMDAFLVFIGMIDTWILKWVDDGSSVGFLTLLRVFRLLRLLRLVRVLKVLKSNKELLLLLQGLGAAIRAMSWGMLLLLIANFICSLLVCKIAGKRIIEWDGHIEFTDEFEGVKIIDEESGEPYDTYEANFGTLPRTMFTLFMFTMEFQADNCRETFHDGAWMSYFLLFWTFLSCFALLGTIGSVIVEAILAISASNHEEEEAEEKEKTMKERKGLMNLLYDALDSDRTGIVDQRDLDLTKESVRDLIEKCGVAPQEASEVCQAVADDKGAIPKDKFVNGMMRLRSDIEGKDMLRIECEIGACQNRLKEAIKDQERLLEILEAAAAKRGS